MVFGTDVGDALHGKFIERVERQLFHFQLLTAAFHLVDHALDTPGPLSFVLVLLLGMVTVVDEQPLTQILPLQGCEAVEPIEISVVILRDDLFYQAVLCLCDRTLRAFPDEQHEVFQEARLLHIHFRPIDAEWVHRNRSFLGIGNVLAAEVFAKSLVAVTRIDHHHVRSLLVQLAHDRVHVEALAAARRTETEKVRVVRQLVFPLLSRDVDSHRHALAVCVIDFQRCLLAVLYVLLIHQAHRRVTQRQEAVIVLVHAVAVARKRVHEQFQLVVRPFGNVDTHTSESILQVVRAFLQVRIGRYGDDQVEMGVHELLAFPCDDLLHPLDVLHGHLVARIGNTGVPVLLFVQQGQFPFLVGQENNLVIDDRLRIRNVVDGSQQVHGHIRVIDLYIGVRPYQ